MSTSRESWRSRALAGRPARFPVARRLLRHTFATDIYRETSSIRLTQKALGHADLSTTQIYTQIVDEELEGALKSFRRAPSPAT
jgi:site-specific recombinase XerD